MEIVPAADAGHVLREKHVAEHEGRAMRHAYREMPLTGAPAARFPKYLQASQFDRYPDLDGNGHDPATLDPGASEHSRDHETGWIDATALYITDGDGKVTGFRKADGSVASEEDLAADARRYAILLVPTGGLAMSTIIRMCANRHASRRQNTRNHLPMNQPSSDKRADSSSGDSFS